MDTVEPSLKDHPIGHKNVVKTAGLWWQVQLYWNVGLAENASSVKAGRLSWQLSVEGFHCIANDFNRSFCEIGQKKKSFEKYLDRINIPVNSMFLFPCPGVALLDSFSSNVNKAIGDMDIPIMLTKTFKEQLKDKFLDIISASFTSGCFLDALIIVMVKPLFKTNKNTDMGNYRPVTILVCISKIIENIMKHRL